MKVVVPMAGRGSRFSDAGFSVPKPLIPVLGVPMLSWALRSIEHVKCSQVIFIALQEHEDQYKIKTQLTELVRHPFEVVLLNEVTDGQLSTVLAAKSHIDTEEDLLVISSDTFVISDIGKQIAGRSRDCAGIISVAKLPGDHWSFAEIDKSGRVVRVAEKERISDLASTGLYYFSNGKTFLGRGKEMIARNERTKNEFYVIPLYNKYLERGEEIRTSIAGQIFDMGNPVSLRASELALKQMRT